MDVYVGIEGYTLPSGYICKELCLMYPNNEYSYYLFKAPQNKHFSEVDHRTIRYTTANLNGLSWYDGHASTDDLPSILREIQQYKIYTYSEIAKKMLQEMLPISSVTNIQTLGFRMPAILPHANCGRIHKPRYCAMAKATAIKDFVEDAC